MPALHRVFLVGPMGAGKTTIGKYLADHLKLQFADTDSEIESRNNTKTETLIFITPRILADTLLD